VDMVEMRYMSDRRIQNDGS